MTNRICYLLLPKKINRWPLQQLLLWILYRLHGNCRRYKGVLLVASVVGRELRFFELLQAAIDLLDTYDPRRAFRLRQTVSLIADRRAGASWYLFPSRIIETDIGSYPNVSNPAAYCAAILVHESTHGFLLSRIRRKGTESIWKRCEYLCSMEASRFLQKIPKGRDLSQRFERLAQCSTFDPKSIRILLEKRRRKDQFYQRERSYEKGHP